MSFAKPIRLKTLFLCSDDFLTKAYQTVNKSVTPVNICCISLHIFITKGAKKPIFLLNVLLMIS